MQDPADLMRSLPRGCGMELVLDGLFTQPKIRTAEEMKALFEDPSLRNIVSMVLRPGGAYFARHLELKHYTPGTPKEPEMRMIYINWGEMMFTVTFIPAADEHLIEETAAKTRMVAKKGVQVHGFGGGMNGPMIPCCTYSYVLENIPDDLAYTDPKAACDRQDADIETLEQEWEAGRRQLIDRYLTERSTV